MNSVNINGVNITGGRNITIRNNRVIVDGKDVTPDAKEIFVSVVGNVERIEIDACLKLSVTGDANQIQTTSGDIDIGGNVGGSVSTVSGDVDCGGPINGSVSTVSGDIKQRK